MATTNRQEMRPAAGTAGTEPERVCTTSTRSETGDLLAHLHRGGAFAYYWTNPGKLSHWYEVGGPLPILSANGANVYFGVHPTAEIPPENGRGEPAPPEKVRSQIKYIAAISCLFGEFDAKDFGGDKSAALAHVDNLDPAPSVVIDSGGGYHAYWLLREPYALTTESKRERAREIQARWVTQVGGDQAAKDLARVLRVPGTINHKYEHKPTVAVIRADFSLLYDLDELEMCICAAEYSQEQDTALSTHEKNGNGNVRAAAWAATALAQEIANLAQAANGGRNDQLNVSAFSLGQIIGAGLLDRGEVEQALSATGRGIGLEERETLATIKSGLEAGMKKPRGPKDDTSERRQHARPLGARIPSGEACTIVEIAPESPDPKATVRIFAALLGTDEDEKPVVTIRRQKAGRIMLDWLQEHGGFVQSRDEQAYYFYRDGRRVFSLDSDHFAAWLYALTGANPASIDFTYLMADCKAAGIVAPVHPVLRVSKWDDRAQELRVSRFDGTVYVLDGDTIREEANGETVLFDDSPTWTPYMPDVGRTGALYWHTTALPNWSGDREAYGLALRAWIVGTLFTELCPTRPFAVMIGEKGSGKTMTLRLLLRFLFGPGMEVSGIPDKPDGFTAAAAAAHLLVLDNLDDFRGWMRDKLARLSTGAVDEYRKLYTSNDVGHVYYRCWLAFTSRTPDTLRRDDLADRLLLLPVDRLEAGDLEAERSFLTEAADLRGRWWGEVLYTANKVVAAIRRGELQSQARLRMADWESLGRLVAQVEGMLSQWDAFIEQLTSAQADFLLEGDLLVDGLAAWMENASNHGREVTSKMLHEQCTTLLFDDRKPPRDWPASTVSFGKRLAAIRRELRTLWCMEWGKGTEPGPTHNRLVYRFWPREATQEVMEGWRD